VRLALFIGALLSFLPPAIGVAAHNLVEAFKSGSFGVSGWLGMAAMLAVVFWPERKERAQ
jgi:hypothetical protein